MATALQTLANKQNALKSTGPKSAQGKTLVSRNAVRHGAMSDIAVVPGIESAEEWQTHLDETIASIAPVGRLETMLAERVALLSWRMLRVARYERDSVVAWIDRIDDDIARKWAENDQRNHSSPSAAITGYQESLKDLDLITRFIDMADDAPIFGEEAFSLLYNIAGTIDMHPTDIKWPGGLDAYSEDGNWTDFPKWSVALLRECIATVATKKKKTPEQILLKMVSETTKEVEKNRREAELAERTVTRYQRERIIPKDDVLVRVERYEAHLSKQFTLTLAQLQAIQAGRRDREASQKEEQPIDIVASETGSIN
jgi:hypothetical protein